MYQDPNHWNRYEIQAFEARLKKWMEELIQPLKNHAEGRQATYTIQQFAAKTGLSYDCVLAKCRRGKLNARQDGPGTRWTINGEELDRYLTEGKDNRW